MLDRGDRPQARERRLLPWLAGGVTDAQLFLILLPLALAIYGLTSRYPGYVHQDTAQIVMFSRLGFEQAYNQHPPLLPWILRTLEMAVPLEFVTLGILPALNAGVGAWAVWRIARLVGGIERSTVAILLYCLIPFATFEAVKLNHNTILVSLWPLTTWAFLLALRSPTWRRGLVLGALAALAMLAKYYSALLLLALALAALASRDRTRFFTSPAPYVAAIAGLVLLAPHLAWLMGQQHASTVKHALYSANDPGTLPAYFVRRLALTFLPLATGLALLRLLLGPARDDESNPDRDDMVRVLVIVSVVPMALTVGLILALGLRASPTWVQPVFLVLPAALAAMLAPPAAGQILRMHQLGRLGLLVAVVAGPIVLWTGFRLDVPSAVVPYHETARRAAAVWHAALQRRVVVVGGDHLAAQTAAMVLPDQPRAWSRMYPEPWITPELLQREGLLILCGGETPRCLPAAEEFMAQRGGFQCDITGRRKLFGRQGPVSTIRIFVIPRLGERVDSAAAAKLCD